jgi:hypothetical protein
LLDGRNFPSIEDLEPASVEDFAPDSVLLDFTAGGENPAAPYIGSAIREECGLGQGIETIDQVPGRSLLCGRPAVPNPGPTRRPNSPARSSAQPARCRLRR